MLRGMLIGESLRVGAELLLSEWRVTKVHRVAVKNAVPPQPDEWVLLHFEADDRKADAVAESLARALKREGGWYADFEVSGDHVVVFADRIFRYPRGDRVAREEAVCYGRSVGVPDHQLDWQQ